eukprot:Em0022g992a
MQSVWPLFSGGYITGLHMTQGVFMKLFRLLEATCHQFDLQLAYTYQEESSSSSSFTKYTEELHKLQACPGQEAVCGENAKTTKVTSKEFALHDGPFVKGLDEALQSFKVQYFGGVFVGNHIHKTLQVIII